jgi:hypothetical protein
MIMSGSDGDAPRAPVQVRCMPYGRGYRCRRNKPVWSWPVNRKPTKHCPPGAPALPHTTDTPPEHDESVAVTAGGDQLRIWLVQIIHCWRLSMCAMAPPNRYKHSSAYPAHTTPPFFIAVLREGVAYHGPRLYEGSRPRRQSARVPSCQYTTGAGCDTSVAWAERAAVTALRPRHRQRRPPTLLRVHA